MFVFIKGTYIHPWYSRTRFMRELFLFLLKEHIFIHGTLGLGLRELFLFLLKEHISINGSLGLGL